MAKHKTLAPTSLGQLDDHLVHLRADFVLVKLAILGAIGQDDQCTLSDPAETEAMVWGLSERFHAIEDRLSALDAISKKQWGGRDDQ